MTFEALAEALGMSRARELRNPRRDGWLRRAERDGLVRRTSGGLALIEGWEREEDRVRERTGEIAAYTRNQELYKRRRLDWLDRLNGVTGEKRLPGKKEVQARRDLEVLREAGAV